MPHPTRLLIIDDDAVDRLAARRSLAALGEVDEASGATEALNAVRDVRYDLAVVDYFLPPDTGPEVLTWLREVQPGLPAVFLSGSGTEDVAVEAMKSGGEDYVSKSVMGEPGRLREVVRAALVSSRLRHEAERAQSRLALAVEAARLGTWGYEPQTQSFRGDARFRVLLGLSDGERWTQSEVLAAFPEDQRARLAAALEAGAVTLQLPVVGVGDLRWVDLRGRLDVAAPRTIFGTALDVSAEKEAERRSALMRERLMGIASHDLKNPLSAVKQASALLAKSPNLDEKERRFVAHIRTSAERMTNLVVQLLDLTRVRLAGGLPLARQNIDLRALVDSVAEELRLTHPERVVRLDVNAVTANADPDRLAQLASNLIGNALKHSPPHSEVSVGLTSQGDDVVLSVHNGGEPIPPDVQALIFDPFVQIGDKATRDGLGLGLHISREIMRAHGGTLTVSSTPTEGTRFTARWPRASS